MSDVQAYIALCADRNTDIEVSSDIGLKINGADNFTLDAWIRISDVVTRQVFFRQEDGFTMGTADRGFFLAMKGYPILTSDNSRGSITAGSWTHLCVVCSASQFYFYIDGVFNRFMTVSGMPFPSTGKPFVFDKEWRGDLYMLRILKTDSDALEVSGNLFKDPEQLTAPWGNNVAAWYDFSGNEPFERVRNQKIDKACKLLRRYTPSIEFTSGNASVSVKPASFVNPGGFDADPYLISAIVYFTPVSGQTVYTLFSNRQVADGKGVSLSIEQREGTFKVKSVFGSQELFSSSELSSSKWTEIKTVYKDHCISIYIDGKESGRGVIPRPDSALYLERRLDIGAETSPAGGDAFSFRGRLSELQIYRTDCLCARYTYFLNDYTNTVDSIPSLPNASVKWGESVTDVLPPDPEKQIREDSTGLKIHPCQSDETIEWWTEFFFLLISKTVFILSGIEIKKNDRLFRFIENNFMDHPHFRTLPAMINEPAISGFWETCANLHLLNHLVETLFEEALFKKLWLIRKLVSFSTGMKNDADSFKDLFVLLRSHIDRKPLQFCLPPAGLLFVMPDFAATGKESPAIPLRKNLWETYPCAIWTPRNQNVPLAFCRKKLVKGNLVLKAGFASCQTKEFVFYAKATGDLTGDSNSVRVTMKAGRSIPESVSFTFPRHTFGRGGVRKERLKLAWKYSTDNVSWQTMMDCEHPVYIVPDDPFKPWTTGEEEGASELRRPWTQVLDYTTEWARGTCSAREIAVAVVEKINQASGLKYDRHQGADHFIDDEVNFRLTRFLKQLATDTESCLVNSRDCAAIITTFANIAGCTLAEKLIGWNFCCNKIIMLGDTCWNKPFDEVSGSAQVPGILMFHEVAMLKDAAWKKNNDYLIYDASMQVDGSVTPDNDIKPDSGRTALLPAGICFSRFPDGQGRCEEIPAGDSYREHLAANRSEGIMQCSYDTTTTFNEDETYQYKPIR